MWHIDSKNGEKIPVKQSFKKNENVDLSKRHLNKRILQKKYVQSAEEKKKNTHINFNINYHREMKLIPINIDCLLELDALKFS